MKTTFFLKTAALQCLVALITFLPASESDAQSSIRKRDTGRTTKVPTSRALVKPDKSVAKDANRKNGGLFKKSDKREAKPIPQVEDPTNPTKK